MKKNNWSSKSRLKKKKKIVANIRRSKVGLKIVNPAPQGVNQSGETPPGRGKITIFIPTKAR